MGDSLDHSSSNGHTSQATKPKDVRTEDTKVEFSEDEEMLIARMFNLVRERWSLIAGRIPGRTAEEIEEYWTSRHCSGPRRKDDPADAGVRTLVVET